MPQPASASGRIPVVCPCGANFTVESKFAGRQGKCPKCGQSILVPTPQARVSCPKCHFLNRAEDVRCSQCGEFLREPAPGEAVPKTAMEAIEERRGTRRTTRPPAALPPQDAQDAPAGEAPSAEPVARRAPALRSKLAELEKPRRSVVLRFLVFLILGGGAAAGTFYGGRSYAEPKISAPREAEAEARKNVWPAKSLDVLHDGLKALSKAMPRDTISNRETPEEMALRTTIEAEIARLKKENQDAVRKADAAHAEMEKWQLGWYAAIVLAGLLAGLIGWKLSG
ncbi:MAG: zinc ribbon domain-containing protein [Planctomycetota bacterium]|mgnify:CR=1 FL=1